MTNADYLKLQLAEDMADWQMENDNQGEPWKYWMNYYLAMRDFELLDIWMESRGEVLLTKLDSTSLN